jgi:elongation factor 1 alpha-like protein
MDVKRKGNEGLLRQAILTYNPTLIFEGGEGERGIARSTGSTMSRHRAVRNLNLDEELADDDDGFGEEDNPYEDISEEDQIQLEDALARLISLIGSPGDESGFTEREMKDALWDTFFDVDQALNGLVEERTKREVKEKKKAGKCHS